MSSTDTPDGRDQPGEVMDHTSGMRGLALASVLLLVVVTGCGAGSETPASREVGEPTTPIGRDEDDDRPPAPAAGVGDECGEVAIEPGNDGIDWLAATDDPWGFGTLTVAVDGGFVIPTAGCVTVVDVDGTLRWSRVTGHVLNSSQIGDHIVVLTTPTTEGGAMVTAYDSATGGTVWEDTQTVGVWESLIALDDVIVVTGTGEGLLVATFAAETGEVLDTRSGRAGVAPVFPLHHDDVVVLGLADQGEGRLVLVDGSGTAVSDVPIVPRYPVPIAVIDDTVVVQASGMDDNTADVEAATFLAAYALGSGAQVWQTTVEGAHAERAVAVGDTVVVSTSAGVTALDARTGERRWVAGPVLERPAMVAALGGDSFAAAGADGVLRVLELADGAPRWDRPIDGITRLLATPAGDLLVATDAGRYLLLDPLDGTELWAATGPSPTIRDTPPNHRQMVAAGDTYATIGCPGTDQPCERTDQRIVAVTPTRP